MNIVNLAMPHFHQGSCKFRLLFFATSLILLFPSAAATPNPQPGEPSNFFKSMTSWVDPDKIPSLEVKVGYDGVSVSTGPSREQIYWTIALSVGGACLVMIILGVICCLCLNWNKRRRNQMELTRWNDPQGGRTRLHIDIPGSFMVLNPTLGTPIQTGAYPGSSNSGSQFQQPPIFATSASKEFVNLGHGMWRPK